MEVETDQIFFIIVHISLSIVYVEKARKFKVSSRQLLKLKKNALNKSGIFLHILVIPKGFLLREASRKSLKNARSCSIDLTDTHLIKKRLSCPTARLLSEMGKDT